MRVRFLSDRLPTMRHDPSAKKITWVAVTDAHHLRILERAGGEWTERSEEAKALAGSTPHGTSAERPGRSYESVGAARHAIEARQDPQEAAKLAFAGAVADRLEQAAADKRYQRLVLMAPPRFLGELRSALGDRARALLYGTLNKDLTQAPLHEIVEHLAESRSA